MTFLDEAVRRAENAMEMRFLFRKLGLPFDFASEPDDFPSRCFAVAKETRAGIPNPRGLGAGFAHSCRNHALLFDGYLSRIELGIESPSDEMILDRLIGGLIRLATVAPKAFLIGGLSADGRGFYGAADWRNHAAWCFAVARGFQTAAISPESQEKFRSIVGKWHDKLKRDRFQILGVDGKPAANSDLSRKDPLIGPAYLAVLLAGALIGGEAGAFEAYESAAAEEGAVRLSPAPRGAPDGDDGILWRQAALSVIASRDPVPERAALARSRMVENAAFLLPAVGEWRNWDRSLTDLGVDLDWRGRPRAPEAETEGLGFRPHESWERMAREQTLQKSLAAMLVVLLSGDGGIAGEALPEMEACIADVPWGKVFWLDALAPVISIHARGAEMGLWDKGLYDSIRVDDQADVSISAKYLDPDYDRRNPDKAGHRGPPPGKAGRQKPESESGRRKKRRRRKL